MENQQTPFLDIYKIFLSLITDDMYMELSKEETLALQEELLINSLSYFEFPRQNIYNYDIENKYFNTLLTQEEKNIIAIYMVVVWIGQQLANVDLSLIHI